MNTKKRLFKVQLEGKTAEEILKEGADKLSASFDVKLEEKTSKAKGEALEAAKVELETAVSAVKVELQSSFEEQLTAHKQEIIELQKVVSKNSNSDMTEIEKIQLQRLNACQKDGEAPVSLEAFRKYHDDLTSQTRRIMSGENVQLDATIAGYAGYDDAKGGALIVPEVDKNIRQDFVDHDMGLFNMITFEPAMSRTKKVIVDTIEPDENTKAVKESLNAINYTLADGGFVEATVNLKDYDTPARVTFDMIEDSAFRVESYVNGKLVQGSKLAVAKDLFIGNGAQGIKGLIHYPQGSGYGKVGIANVATTGTVTMDDIMKLCIANKNKGVLVIDKATWSTAITEKSATDGKYLFELGAVGRGQGSQPFHVDAYVPFLNVPVVFDDGFTLDEVVAADIVAAILPPSAFAGYKKPVGRFSIKPEHKYKDMLLTERYDAVLAQFKYVRVLLGTKSA